MGSSLSMEQACYQACADYPGGVRAISAIYGWKESTVAKELDPASTGHKLGVGRAMEILRVTKDPRILDSVTAQAGAIWFDISSIEGVASDMAMLENVNEMIGRVGELTASINRSLADGVVDKNELRELETVRMRVIQSTEAVFQRAKQFAVED